MAACAAWPMALRPIRQPRKAVAGRHLRVVCLFKGDWVQGAVSLPWRMAIQCIGMIFLPEFALLSRLVMCEYLLCPSLYSVPKSSSSSSKGTGPKNFWLQNQIRLLCSPSQKCINTQWPKPKHLTLWNE